MWSRHIVSLIAVALICLSGMLYDEEFFNNVWTQTARTIGGLSFNSSTLTTTNQRILLVTYVFSEQAANKRYLRMFLESAATAGVDLVMVGDHRPPYALPSNVKHNAITWNDFCSLVEKKLDIDVGALRTTEHYKIIDFKPLFAFLFPDIVQPYGWWGHVDNDMLVGDILGGVAPYLSSVDIVSGIKDHPTWGPFTLYRNVEQINTLFQQATATPQQMFGIAEPVCFDEWGQCGPLKRNKGASMSGIIERLSSIRVQQGIPNEVVWDGHCKFKTFGRPKHRCSECAYRRQGSTPLVSRNTDGTYQPAFLCHYEYAKHRIEDGLETTQNMESMLVDGEFRVNFLDGFQPLLEEDKPKMEIILKNSQKDNNLRSKATITLAAPQAKLPTIPIYTAPSVEPTERVPIPPANGPQAAKVLLVSYIFSEATAHRRYVQFFAETASTSGADILLLGDVRPPFPLPANVRHYLISWIDFIDLSILKLDLKTTNEMRNATMYKVNDFKPLFAYLFPELVDGYEWWGHIDNDLLLGDVATVLARYGGINDIISGSPDHSTWGPFTLFRNTADINKLFQRASISLDRIFGNPKPVCFDEWGSCGFKRWPGASMAGIVDANAAELGLRIQRGIVGLEAAWDGFCQYPKYGYSKQHCAECTYRRYSARRLQILHADGESVDALLCHYQYTKPRLEASLANVSKVKSMLEAGAFRVNYLDGFQEVNVAT